MYKTYNKVLNCKRRHLHKTIQNNEYHKVTIMVNSNTCLIWYINKDSSKEDLDGTKPNLIHVYVTILELIIKTSTTML